jgi:hypothetical protein
MSGTFPSKQKREDNNSSALQLLPRLLTSPQHITSILHLPLVDDVFEEINGSEGVLIVSVWGI